MSKATKPKKLYTVSTKIFHTLAEAEAQIQKWDKQEGLNQGTMIFECTGKVYRPKLKLVEDKNYDTPPKKQT